MHKRGAEFAVGTVIMIVLGLIVLVILSVVVRNYVTKGTKQYSEIGEQAQAGADVCQSILSGRSCASSCSGDYENAPNPPGGVWSDCGKAGTKLAEKRVCCQKRESVSP
ncbi:hypothetical protein HY489_04210 [Candidatus Woesearchaeota archaeon]|nr:hypothetical protein [Candidatus Woesearchaeota archaeon]